MTEFGPEYPKINSLFKRDTAIKGNPVSEWQWATPEFELLKDVPWYWTQKIDGTNTRLHWDGQTVTLGGRSDNAQIPVHLVEAVRNLGLFKDGIWGSKWPPEPNDGSAVSVTVYGEGYGPKIQKGGGLYGTCVSFIVFDVRVGPWWLSPEDVRNVANDFGLEVVPEFGTFTPVEAWNLVKEEKLVSTRFPAAPMEGLVGKPAVPLFDRKGSRIIAKTKNRDWAELQRLGLSTGGGVEHA